MSRKKQPPAVMPRNLLHDHPLLRKGGPHRKTAKAMRRKEKASLKGEWCPQSAFPENALSTPFAAIAS